MNKAHVYRLVLVGVWLLGVGVGGHGTGQLAFAVGNSAPVAPADSVENAPPPDPTQSQHVAADSIAARDLLDLDIEQLSQVPVRVQSQQTNLTAPSSQLNAAAAETGEATTTADLLRLAPGVSARRVSAISLDPRVRGYHSSQLNGTANGMNQLKSRVDIDTLFSQIDPGVVQDITVIDGPYTSLYGPGFAFMVAELLPAPRFANGSETQASTNFVYGSNAQTLYTRDNVISGGKHWGMCFSYGLRTGNDYLSGGNHPFAVPSSYQKWDGLLAVSFDLSPVSRIELDCLRTEMNHVELPGVVYDIQNSTNDQFNLRYVVQEAPDGPQQLVVQSWYTQTPYFGDASHSSKQETLYRAFFSEPAYDDYPVNTLGRGSLESLGVRLLRTFGQADSAQWTVGADWRRYRQHYEERNVDSAGEIIYAGDIFGIPRSQMDDIGALTELTLPMSEALSITVGGRVDQCKATMDANDPVVTEFSDPEAYYYCPGFAEPSHTLGMAYLSAKRKLNECYTLRAGTAFAMRMPDLTELYNDEPYVPFARFGNTYIDGLSTLRPEKNMQIDLGLGYETKKVTWGFRVFYSRIRDYIMPVPAILEPSAPDSIVAPKVLGRDFRYFPIRTDIGTLNENADTCEAGYQYVNIDEAVLLGADLSGEVQLRDGLSLFGTMAYVYGVNNSPVNFISDEETWSSPDGHVAHLGGSDGLPGIYPFNGTVGVRRFEPTEDRWSIEFLARLVRGQDHPAVTLSEIPAPGFSTFDLRGYYRLRKNVRVSLDLQNLLDRKYTEPGSLAMIGPSGLPVFIPEPGFSALLGIDARF